MAPRTKRADAGTLAAKAARRRWRGIGPPMQASCHRSTKRWRAGRGVAEQATASPDSFACTHSTSGQARALRKRVRVGRPAVAAPLITHDRRRSRRAR